MSIQTIERAFTLLRALALGPVGVTELAERVELPKSTVARLLAALEAEKRSRAGRDRRWSAARPDSIDITELPRTRRSVTIVDNGPVSRFGSPRRSLV